MWEVSLDGDVRRQKSGSRGGLGKMGCGVDEDYVRNMLTTVRMHRSKKRPIFADGLQYAHYARCCGVVW